MEKLKNSIKEHIYVVPIITLVIFAIVQVIYWNSVFDVSDANTQFDWFMWLANNNTDGILTLNEFCQTTGPYTEIYYFMVYFLFIKTGLFPLLTITSILKIMAIFWTLIGCLFVYKIVNKLTSNFNVSVIIASIALLLPTFLLDSLKNNAPDSMYITLILVATYYLLSERTIISWTVFMISAIFKLMAIYVLPMFVIVYILYWKRASIWSKLSPIIGALIAILITGVPSVLIGGSIYNAIIVPITDRSANTPSIFAFSYNNLVASGYFIGQSQSTSDQIGISIFAILFFVLAIVSLKNLQYLDNALIYGLIPALSVLIATFTLPSQHETYFSAAAIFTLFYLVMKKNKQSFMFFMLVNILLSISYLGISLQLRPDGNLFFGTYTLKLIRSNPINLWLVSFAMLLTIVYGLNVYKKNLSLNKNKIGLTNRNNSV